jgi:hypothetical protein
MHARNTQPPSVFRVRVGRRRRNNGGGSQMRTKNCLMWLGLPWSLVSQVGLDAPRFLKVSLYVDDRLMAMSNISSSSSDMRNVV